MALTPQLTGSGWREPGEIVLAKMARAHTAAIREWTEAHKEDQRAQVIGGGLGERLARTWRGKAYPEGTKESLDPAGFVYVNPGKGKRGNAPTIIEFYSGENVIHPVFGKALAIPSKDCPKTGASRGARRFMTPLEVEGYFNAELIEVKLDGGNLGLFIDVIPGLSTVRGGYRPKTARRVSAGRKSKLILMFTLVFSVKGKKRIDHRATANLWYRRFPEIMNGNLRLVDLD